jgi:hypothetical protein
VIPTFRDRRLVNKICARHDQQRLVIATQLLFSKCHIMSCHASAKRCSVKVALLPALDTNLQARCNTINITAQCC